MLGDVDHVWVTTTVPQPNPRSDGDQLANIDEAVDEELDALLDAPFVVRWGLFDALLGFPAVIVGTLVVAVAWSFVASSSAVSFAGANAFTVITMQLMMASWAVWTTRRKGNGPVSDFGLTLHGLSDFISSVVLGFSLLMIGSVVAGLALWLLGVSPEEQTTNVGIVTQNSGTVWQWVMIGSVAIGAPIAEELFFRGLLLGALRRRFGSFVGVVGSALAFTSVHYVGGSLEQSIMLFSVVGAIGVVLGAYVVRTGRVLPTIIAHSVFNTLVVIANF